MSRTTPSMYCTRFQSSRTTASSSLTRCWDRSRARAAAIRFLIFLSSSLSSLDASSMGRWIAVRGRRRRGFPAAVEVAGSAWSENVSWVTGLFPSDASVRAGAKSAEQQTASDWIAGATAPVVLLLVLVLVWNRLSGLELMVCEVCAVSRIRAEACVRGLSVRVDPSKVGAWVANGEQIEK